MHWLALHSNMTTIKSLINALGLVQALKRIKEDNVPCNEKLDWDMLKKHEKMTQSGDVEGRGGIYLEVYGITVNMVHQYG